MKKTKKILLLICILTCVFALTSCGKDKKEAPFKYDESKLVSCITTNTEMVADWNNETIKNAIDDYDEDDENEAVLIKGLEQFMEMRKEAGDYVGFYLDDNENVIYSVKEDDDTVAVKVKAKFSKRDVKITYTFYESHNEINIQNMLYEPQYTIGETMKKAALNTVIGLITVAGVLLFLSALISQFRHVNKLQRFGKWFRRVFKADKNVNNGTSEKVNEEVVSNSEMVVSEDNDTELVAVITAAIMADRGSVSADGFVVRSIKRVSRRKW